MSAEPTTITAYQCPGCVTIYADEADLVPLYECSRCGQNSPERRCDECNIFMARAGIGCEDCAAECEEVEAVEDHDGQLIPADEWEPEGSKADRDAAESARRDRERAERKRQEQEERDAASEVVPVSALAVGDWIMHPAPHPSFGAEPVQVKALLEWGSGSVGVVVADFGMPQVLPAAPEQQFTRVPPQETRRRGEEPFGTVTFDPDGGAMLMSSVPREEEYVIELSTLDRGTAPWGGVPSIAIMRRTPGLLSVFGVFVARSQAEETLAVWERAGRALAEGAGLSAAPTRQVVKVETAPMSRFADSLGRAVEFTLGTSEWEPESERLYLNARLSGSNATVAAPEPFLGAVEAAREHLGHLDH